MGICFVTACDKGNIQGNESGVGALQGSTGADEAADLTIEQSDAWIPDPADLEDFEFPVLIEKLTIHVPGMQGEKHLLYLSDLHLITVSDQIADDQLDTVKSREEWSSFEGVTAAESWPMWVEYLNLYTPDAVLFGGDMIDFASRSNVEAFGKSLENLAHPYLYVRADHDLAPSYLEGVFESESIGYQREIAPYDDIMIMEFDEFFIAGWNNSTAQMTAPGLEKMKSLVERAKNEGKAIILLTHVPIKPLGENLEAQSSSTAQAHLVQKSKEAWGDRVLLWGEGCMYQPNELTTEFLNLIYADDTPFVEILCGHLHFTWDGYVTEKVHQHIFNAALGRNLGIVFVKGD